MLSSPSAYTSCSLMLTARARSVLCPALVRLPWRRTLPLATCGSSGLWAHRVRGVHRAGCSRGVAVALKEKGMGQFSELLHGGAGRRGRDCARARGYPVRGAGSARETRALSGALLTPGIGDRDLRLVRGFGGGRDRRHDRRATHASNHGPGIRHQHRRSARDPEFPRRRHRWDRNRYRRWLPHRAADAEILRPNECRTNHGPHHHRA
jgi:hypothetical protein